MSRPWLAESAVTLELARELIEASFTDLAPARLRSLGVGWDNTAFRVNDTWVFRFPRRQVAVALLDAENAVLPGIASSLPLPVPIPTRIARDVDARFPWPFSGYRMLAGHTADCVRLDARQREVAAVPIAKFLAALHALPPAEAAPRDDLRRLDVEYRTPRVVEGIERARAFGYLDDVMPWQAILDDTPTDYAPGATTLVHGDLHAANILVDEAGRISGVIDWGDVHRGDPALDLSIAHGFLPPKAHAIFRAAYGPIGDDEWRVARFKALQTAIVLLLYAHDIANEPLRDEALTSLRYLGG